MDPKKVEVEEFKTDLCPTCASLTGQVLNQLLNIILNGGVVGGCSNLCGKLDNKLESSVCNLACDYVGIQAFAAALKKADLDPIYFCQLLKACPHSDGGKAQIKAMSVSPSTGAIGTTFEIAVGFEVFNQTSVGVFDIHIDGPGACKFQDQALNEGFAPGSYSVAFQFATHDDEPGQILPGPYNVTVSMCNGECGSSHPWSGFLDDGNSSFTLTV